MKVKNVIKNFLKGLVTVLVIAEVILMCSIMIFKALGKNPDLFGYQFYVIISPSMEPELRVGDVILSRKYTGQTIETGDIITFLGKKGDYKGRVVTHQVIRVEEIDGELRITTKGLTNNVEDPSIEEEDVLSVMERKMVVFGFIYRLICSTPGFILLILLPLLILIASEIYRLAKLLHSEENDDENQQKGETDCER